MYMGPWSPLPTILDATTPPTAPVHPPARFGQANIAAPRRCRRDHRSLFITKLCPPPGHLFLSHVKEPQRFLHLPLPTECSFAQVSATPTIQFEG
ncbi:hypothetical protein HYQ45_001849 [Verticillium longisporum]|uniref:Uncharacterized protein n=1 Tax=Verticillium longisporum TaxID=100787 RepID=A0A8I3A0G2_VERLO|nr:hypothetical protein HYQ45_001849 [Verticillium longisporum]